ncbi:MAG: glycoside hydrolase family 3 C-terminal domain-containing protein [Bacteroidales bacterium]|nr:glycoside hydrolase family 3 C-terminal domain-containing protein [Bacteroidales bacterium]
MNKPTKKLLTAAVACSLASCASGPADNNIDKKVDALYEKMSQEERLAQLHGIYLTQFFDEEGNLDTAKCAEIIPNGIGHFSQFALNTRKSADELRDMVATMQNWLIKNTPNGIPALFHEEVLSGVNGYDATVYPQQIGLACSFNPELAEEKTYQTGAALHKVGGYMALSPMVDVVRNPSFNRLEESYGEDSYLSAAMGVAFVKGLQHGDLREGVAACTKHFLGYGGGGDADKKELMEEILLPHEAIIRMADSKVLMPGYHAIDGTKCVANREVLQGILRDYLHYDGIVVSDYGAIEQIDDNMSDVERAAAAINAGNDVDFPEGNSYKHLFEAMDKGLVSQQTFETAVKRVLKLKALTGLLDENPVLAAEGHIEFDTPEERQTSYKLATQSVVLLRNNGILPLNKPSKIALTGPNANSMWAMLGDYTYQSMRFFWKSSIEDDMHPRIINLKDGLTSRLPEGSSLEYSRGCDWTEKVETVVESSGDPRVAYLVNIQNRMIDSGEKADMKEALAMAKKSDVIIAAVGENAILCGENRDRQHLRLPGRQEEYVEELIATGKPVILVIFGGRAQVISKIADKCAAVIQAWYPGEEGGNALADIIYGNVNPSGKLSVSYPNEEIHEAVCYNYGNTNDSRIAYPFGYGLSYTTYEYSNMTIDSVAKTDGGRFNVSVEVKNTGNVAGEEIVQLYVSPLDRSAKLKPIQLQGFKRVALASGESKTVTFAVSPQQLGYYANGEWSVDAGRYMIKLGASSADIRQEKEITLTGDNHTMALRDCYFAE